MLNASFEKLLSEVIVQKPQSKHNKHFSVYFS